MTESRSFEDVYKVQTERIAQLEHELAALRESLAQKEQEPVAWCIVENGRIHGLVKSKPAVMNAEKWQPLYTALPPRQWQGLTGEEVGALTVFDGLHHVEVPVLADFVRAVEAKIKEKNT